MSTVTVQRTYRSARSQQLVPATTQASWQRLLDALATLGLCPVAFTGEGGDGVTVACTTQRGAAGAVTVHALACRHGALAVIE